MIFFQLTRNSYSAFQPEQSEVEPSQFFNKIYRSITIFKLLYKATRLYYIRSINRTSIHTCPFISIFIQLISLPILSATSAEYIPLLLFTQHITLMFWLILFLLLLHAITYDSQYLQTYSLSPPIPPKAFVGIYYTCDFRVQGVINPIYKFSNLPSFLKGSQNGRIQGTPTQKGTYKFTISYGPNKKSGQTQLILSVSDTQQSISTDNAKQSSTKNASQSVVQPRIYAQFPSIYTIGDDIVLNLPQLFGFPAKTWTYLSLPAQLLGEDNGIISGSFYQEGMYSFCAIHSDENGKTKSFIITLNIQPTFYYDFWPGFDIQSVPVRNQCKCYEKIFQTRKKALSLVQKTQLRFKDAQQKVKQLKDILAQQTVFATMTQNTIKMQLKVKQLILAKQSQLVKIQQSAKALFNKAKSIFDLASFDYNNSKSFLQKLASKLNQSLQFFNKLKTNLQIANNLFTEAQSDSSAVASYMDALQVKITGYNDDVQALYKVVGSAKQTLAKYQNDLTNNSFASSNAYNAKDIANMENDIAFSDLRNKQDTLNRSLQNLKKAGENITNIRKDLNDAADQLGEAKFNLTQMTNQLLISQAAKEMADKNLAIVSNQQKTTILEGTSNYVFGGCDKGLYPNFSGTIPVKELITSGFVLASGHTLLYGNCSKTIQVSKDDLIRFDGYLKDGVIQALQVSKG